MAKEKLQAFFICPLKEKDSAERQRSEFVQKELLLDISSVPFLKDYGGKAFVVRRGRDGKDHRFDEAQIIFNAENLTYSITARNVPADSNITFEWGAEVNNDKEK